MPVKKLSDAQIKTALQELPQWQLDANRIKRQLVFSDFVQAFGFMSQVALCAERANHHPDWSNVYSRVNIELWTHEANGITQRDIDLARDIDTLALTYNL